MKRSEPNPAQNNEMADTRSRAHELFKRIADFDWSPLIAEHSTESVVNYRRFLAVKVLDEDVTVGPELLHRPGAEIDPVWHAHLMRPSYYLAVCAALTGSCDSIVDHKNPVVLASYSM